MGKPLDADPLPTVPLLLPLPAVPLPPNRWLNAANFSTEHRKRLERARRTNRVRRARENFAAAGDAPGDAPGDALPPGDAPGLDPAVEPEASLISKLT